jgi:hypothetical protein
VTVAVEPESFELGAEQNGLGLRGDAAGNVVSIDAGE